MDEEPKQSWLRRNWWVFPAGCLGMILLAVVFVAGAAWLALHFLKSNEAYRQGLQAALNSPAVIDALGEPITPGSVTSGSVKYVNGDASASLEVPLTGPKGSGTLCIEADRKQDQWKFTTLEVEINNGNVILPLLPGGPHGGDLALPPAKQDEPKPTLEQPAEK
jgi:hypothetical protein